MFDKFAIAAVGVAVFVAAETNQAGAAGGGGATAGYVAQYSLEPAGPGGLVRITLSDSAVSRLGIQTEPVAQTEAKRTLVIGGRIADASMMQIPEAVAEASGGATMETEIADKLFFSEEPSEEVIVPAAKETGDMSASSARWVVVQITDDIEASIDAPVRVRRLNGGTTADGVEALPETAINTAIDPDSDDTAAYRIVDGDKHLLPGEIVLVEVPYAYNGQDHKTVPYSSIIYDKAGDEWVYTSPSKNVYVREAVDIAYIEGSIALLIEGPDLGTEVVTVGSAELLGTEYRVGH